MLIEGSVETIRGVALSEKQVADWMRDGYEYGAESFTFHTRAASMGSVCDANCHPQVYGDIVLVHNGHDGQAETIADRFGYRGGKDATDTAAIAWLANMFGPEKILPHMRGNFLGYSNGVPFQYVGDSFWELYRMDCGVDGHIWTSELPDCVKKGSYTSVDLNPYASRFGWEVQSYKDYELVPIPGQNGAYTYRKKEKSKKLPTVKSYLDKLEYDDMAEVDSKVKK